MLHDQLILTTLSRHEECIRLISTELKIEPQELKEYLISKEDQKCDLYIDGGARGNPGESGIGIVMITGKKKIGFYYYTGFSTNNEAEYRALIKALELAYQKHKNELSVYTDSELICKQMNGIYKVKSPTLLVLHQQAKELAIKFKRFSIKNISREKNKEADQLANQAMDLKKNGEIELAVVPNL